MAISETFDASEVPTVTDYLGAYTAKVPLQRRVFEGLYVLKSAARRRLAPFQRTQRDGRDCTIQQWYIGAQTACHKRC
jgi:hypothetical protein